MAMLATLPSWVVSMLLVTGVTLPNCFMNFPSRENFSSCASLSELPVSQTWFLESTRMPCSLTGQSGCVPGPPQAWTRLPSASNSITEGAGAQHRERLGVAVAPLSASFSERGRWKTQMWSWASTVMPPIWPMTQLLGSCFGHDASTLNCGTVSAAKACAPAMTVTLESTAATSILRMVICPLPGCAVVCALSLRTDIRHEFLDAFSGVDFADVEIAL